MSNQPRGQRGSAPTNMFQFKLVLLGEFLFYKSLLLLFSISKLLFYFLCFY